MIQTEEKLPEWMLRLENKRKKPHRLAHEIGAGSPCFICGEKCPGLDLHFWRKLCRNCKCKKEDHDVKDDEGYEQFEILLGGDKRKAKKGGYLNMKMPEDVSHPKKIPTNPTKGVAFDWIPPNVTDDVAAEYMRQLPAGKLPISGSDGALYRRQQLEKQVPLHDLNADHCHNLTVEETQQLMKYLENLKTNVVGLGCVGKIPGLYAETRIPLSGPIQQQALTHGLGRPLATSQSADSIRPLPPMPPAYNSTPRPFHASSSSSAYGSGEDEDVPPALPTSLPPRTDLRTLSEFIDWRFPDSHSASQEKIMEGMKDLHLQPIAPSSVISGSLSQFSTDSEVCMRKEPQYSGQLAPLQPSTDANYVYSEPRSTSTVSQEVKLEGKQSSQILHGNCLPETGFAVSGVSAPKRGNAFLQAQSAKLQGYLVTSQDGVGGPQHLSTGSSFRSGSQGSVDPALVKQDVLSFPSGVVCSSDVNQQGMAQQMKPLHSVQHQRNDSLRHDSSDSKGAMLDENTESLSGSASLPEGSKPNSLFMTPSEMQYGIPGGNRIDEPTPLRIDGVVTSSVLPHSIVQSDAVGTDTLPKSAQVFQQQHHSLLDPSYAVANTGSSGPLPAETPGGSVAHLNCEECGDKLMAGDVAVFAERAGNAAWHPSCFVCTTCKELLVDLMYFYHKNNVYCGRHFAELLGIPRCFACDELIFVKEYTMAEGKFFHVKHFCCYECDGPLAGKQYIPVEDQPVCLECFERIYGKKCHTCHKKIAPGEQRVGWNSLNWHVQGNCFRCYECAKSLLGGRFVVKEEQPFCSKGCVQAGLLKMSGTA